MKRRTFLIGAAGAAAGAAGLTLWSPSRPRAVVATPPPVPANLPAGALVVADPHNRRVHAIDIATGVALASVHEFRASHAVQLVPSRGRAFVHGTRGGGAGGTLAVFQITPGAATVEALIDLPSAPLHWQPRPDLSEIAYNTTGDGGLSIVDTRSLEVTTYASAAGRHSLMAFLDDDVISSNDLIQTGRVKILNRTQGHVDAETQVGGWPHGLTVCTETGRAYCWCADGVHVIGMRGRERGRHLGIIGKLGPGQRCWFAWTPQGGRYSHDVSWSDGEIFQPYLTVVDAKNEKLEKIESSGKIPGTLTVSDDGKTGLASSRNTAEALVFDLTAQKYVGAIPVGSSDPKRFFDRDLSITPGNRWAAVTNPSDPSVSILDLISSTEVARLRLTFSPGWMKLLLT